ncbi:MAG: outer membrane beta-barrel protein [Cyclobacteriaceae bacterium]
MKQFRILSLMGIGLLTSIATDVTAQVQKSDHNIGFGFDLRSISGESTGSSTSINLSYTYYLTNRISLGLGPRIEWTKSTSQTIDPDTDEFILETSKTGSKGINAFLNYSFLTNDGFALPYIGLQFARLIQKEEDTDEITTDNYGGNVGIKFFITERLNVDNNFSVLKVIPKNLMLTRNGIPLDLDTDGIVIQVNVGVGYIIGKRN